MGVGHTSLCMPANDDDSEWEENSSDEEENEEWDTANSTPEKDPQEVKVESEVPSAAEIQSSAEINSLSTFSEQEGPFRYKIIPTVNSTNTNWRVVVYSKGVQGPLFESDTGVSDSQADHFGLTRKLQNRINTALEYANENLRIPSELRTAKRDKKSLHELEVMMEESD